MLMDVLNFTMNGGFWHWLGCFIILLIPQYLVVGIIKAIGSMVKEIINCSNIIEDDEEN